MNAVLSSLSYPIEKVLRISYENPKISREDAHVIEWKVLCVFFFMDRYNEFS